MTENNAIELNSLVSLVSIKGVGRGDEKNESSLRQIANQTASRGFDGFLQTFLGKGKSGKSGKSGAAVADRKDSPRDKDSASYEMLNAGNKMAESDKKELRRCMDKTVEDDRPIEVDEDVAAAAEEAALLIRDLMFGAPDAQELAGPLADQLSGPMESLRELSNMLYLRGEAPCRLGTPGMTLDQWQDALETSNASAEMNSAATFSALDELLDGLPRAALESALGRALGLDGSAGLFNQLASALDARVVNAGGGEAGMLAWLGGSSAHAPGGDSATAGQQLFTDFLKESFGDSPINTMESLNALSGDEMVAAFEKWLGANGMAPGSAGQRADVNKFVESLASHLRGETPAATAGSVTEFMSRFVTAPEGTAESGLPGVSGGLAAGAAAAEALKGIGGSSLSPDSGEGEGESGFGHHFASHAGQQANQAADAGAGAGSPQASTGSMSSMMEQMENIERLADAMRMATKGGIKNLTMQLTPDELGKVMLRVEARDGVVSAYLRVEKPEAAAQLTDNLQQLKDNLKAQGIELGELEIQTRGQNEALGDFGGGRRRHDEQVPDWYHSGESEAEPGSESLQGASLFPTDVEPIGAGGPGELNLIA